MAPVSVWHWWLILIAFGVILGAAMFIPVVAVAPETTLKVPRPARDQLGVPIASSEKAVVGIG